MFRTTVRSFVGVGGCVQGAFGRGAAMQGLVVVALSMALGCGGTGRAPNMDSNNTSESSSSTGGASDSTQVSASSEATSANTGQSTAPVLMGPDVFPQGVTKPK